jgi:hypothetical protein
MTPFVVFTPTAVVFLLKEPLEFHHIGDDFRNLRPPRLWWGWINRNIQRLWSGRRQGAASTLFLPSLFPSSFLLVFLPFYIRKYDEKQIIKSWKHQVYYHLKIQS